MFYFPRVAKTRNDLQLGPSTWGRSKLKRMRQSFLTYLKGGFWDSCKITHSMLGRPWQPLHCGPSVWSSLFWLDPLLLKLNTCWRNQHWWGAAEARLQFKKYAAAAAKLLQSCPTLCDPIDGGPPGSAVPGILQARTLEWVAISFSNVWKWKVKVKLLSKCLTLHDPMDCSLPGSSVHGIFQERVLEWGATAFSIKKYRCSQNSIYFFWKMLSEVSY